MVAATRGKPESLGRKIAGFGIGLQACATGWQRPGKPLFLPGTGWNTTTVERPLPRPRNPAKPRTKKRDSQRNADHKKALPPGQKKAGFSRGALLVAFLDIVGKVSRVRAQTAAKVRTEKKSSKHRGLSTTRPYTKKIIVYHGGISLPLYAGKVCETGHIKKAKTGEHKKGVRDSLPPLPLAAGWLPRGPAWGRFSNSGGFCCKGGCFTRCRFYLFAFLDSTKRSSTLPCSKYQENHPVP